MADDAPASVESTLEAAVSGGFDRPGFAHVNGKSEGNRHRGSLSRRATKRLLIATTGCRSNGCWPGQWQPGAAAAAGVDRTDRRGRPGTGAWGRRRAGRTTAGAGGAGPGRGPVVRRGRHRADARQDGSAGGAPRPARHRAGARPAHDALPGWRHGTALNGSGLYLEARELLRTIQGAKGVKGGWILEAALGRHRQEVTVDEAQGRPHSALSHVATIGLSGDIAR